VFPFRGERFEAAGMTVVIKAILVDDEPLARQRLRQMLSSHPAIQVIQECSNGIEAVQAIEELSPDLVFLDVQMPELDGFGVVEAVGVDRMPPTLFVTAYDQYALRAFEVHALDYLMKPFDRERFDEALERVRRWFAGPTDHQNMEAMINQIRKDRPAADRLLVRSGNRHLFVKISSIQWVEAEDNYVRLHVEGTSYLVRQTMAGMLERLDDRRFRRIHRSAIVNLDFVKELQPWSSGEYLVIMKDGTELTLSRTFREQFAEWL